MELMEGVIVVDGLTKAANPLISGWRLYGGEGLVFLIPLCVVVTRGGGGARIV